MELSPSLGGKKRDTLLQLDVLERVVGGRPSPETLWGAGGGGLA